MILMDMLEHKRVIKVLNDALMNHHFQIYKKEILEFLIYKVIKKCIFYEFENDEQFKAFIAHFYS